MQRPWILLILCTISNCNPALALRLAVSDTDALVQNKQLVGENQRLEQENKKLRDELDRLQFNLQYRCPHLTGPFPLEEFNWAQQSKCIRPETQYEFTMGGQIPFGFVKEEQDKRQINMVGLQQAKAASADTSIPDEPHPFWDENKCKGEGDAQLAGGVAGCLKMQRMSKSTVPFWSKDLVEHFISEVASGRDISPADYWHSAPDVQKALQLSTSPGQKALVVGSISPWIESILLQNANISSVHSVDYNPPKTEHPGITTLSMDEVLKPSNNYQFDVVVSYSSIEHDGLGRYGDPFNPIGDFAAIREMTSLLKPGGMLVLAVPTQAKDAIAFNSARVYGPLRMRELIQQADVSYEGFVLKDQYYKDPTIPYHDLSSPFWNHNVWAEHSVMLLRKPTASNKKSLFEANQELSIAMDLPKWVRKTDAELNLLTTA